MQEIALKDGSRTAKRPCAPLLLISPPEKVRHGRGNARFATAMLHLMVQNNMVVDARDHAQEKVNQISSHIYRDELQID